MGRRWQGSWHWEDDGTPAGLRLVDPHLALLRLEGAADPGQSAPGVLRGQPA